MIHNDEIASKKHYKNNIFELYFVDEGIFEGFISFNPY
jgi:hypothetical protein